MSTMAEIGADLRAHVPEMIEGWKALAAEAPWVELPERERLDGLPDVVGLLVDAALRTPGDLDAQRRVAYAAAKHGEDRRRQGVPEHLLFREYHFLREAIWRYLLTRHAPGSPGRARAADAILRLDASISLATEASLFGYHRAELEREGQWPDRLERLACESPLLRARSTEQ